MSPPSDQEALPPGWSRGYSNSQKRHFYFHKETKHTQWHFPTASEAADPQMAKRRAERNAQQQQEQMESAKKKQKQDVTKSSVAIIVPYRDLHVAQNRAKHLQQFVPHLNTFLDQLKSKGDISDYHIYIIEQSNDERKFNRGKLLNIGYRLAREKKGLAVPHDVFIFHDVDLLPQEDLGRWYAQFPTRPLHIARVWDRYSNNPKYFGGVVSFSISDYKRINGYPNTFWGWGGEDDEMQKRCEINRIKWDAPTSGTLVDLEEMDLQEKLNFLRQNKEWKCMVKWEALEEHDKTWKTNGLADLKYKVLSQQNPLENCKHATKVTVDVMLNGTHWSNEKSGVDFRG